MNIHGQTGGKQCSILKWATVIGVLVTISLLVDGCTPSAYRISEAYINEQPQSAEIVCEDAKDCADAMEDFCPGKAVKVVDFRRHIKDHTYWSHAFKQWVTEPRETISLRFVCK